jgi:serine/threonine protein kinase
MAEEAPAQLDLTGHDLDGRYKIEAILGQGGMGTVYRAMQTSISRQVAIKTLNPSLAAAPQFFERFKREAEVASKLNHPNIITVFDFGRASDGLCYIVMEFLQGESLRERVRQQGPMTLRRASAIIEQVAIGLSHAHQHQVVHRDIKPHNIMLSSVDAAEYVKVLDFGLVKAMENEEEEALTSTGQVLGTPQYMPPEQAGGDVVDHRSDIYSLCGVFYFCLTGTSPFQANSVRKALTAALTQQVQPVATFRKGAPVPRGIDELIRKGLAKEKEDRYQSCDELIQDLQLALEGLTDAELDAQPTGGADGSGIGAKDGSGSTPSSQASKKKGSVSVMKPLPNAALPAGEGTMNSRQPKFKTAPPPPPKKATNPFAFVAIAFFVAAGAGGVYFAVKGDKKAEQPAIVEAPVGKPVNPTPVVANPTPTEAPQVSVSIKTVPEHVELLEDGVLVGTTPLSRQWKKDQVYTVTLQATGYKLIERKLRFDKDSELNLELEKDARAPAANPGPGKKPGGKKPGSDYGSFD